jgi:outer membrane receptor protein involved in Fe transport
MIKTKHHFALFLAGTALVAPALAQEAAPAGVAPNPSVTAAALADREIVVVGTQIRGRITQALPVTVLDMNQIDATGALSGDELFRSIPQMGDVVFNPSNNPQTSNAARGDVNSINLRNLGVGNTLVLLNGRRLVTHPTSQAGEGNVPVLGYNSNSIPVANIQRLEILRDGAAAIYGADAVAGVVNTVLRTKYDGISVDGRWGTAEGTSRTEWQLNGLVGKNFADGAGNISLFADYTYRSAQLAEDQPYTATNDLRGFFADNPAFAGNVGADGRATQSSWANLTVVNGPGTIRRGTTALTSSAGSFHTRSALTPGCTVVISADTCYAPGTRATNTTLREERFDNAVGTTVTPEVKRFNSFLTAHYDLSDDVTIYGEAGYYRATTSAVQPPTINLNAITIPASNFWNPFGPTVFANGTANPNRITGLSNVPAAGLPVRLTTYRFVDTGSQFVDVTNWQSRMLGGLRGKLGSFDFDSAILYSEAQSTDRSDAINMTRLQQSLALSTPDAYNPFSGGCAATPSIGDCSPSSRVAIDSILFKLERKSKTTLALGDFKLSRADLVKLPGGDLGVALGIEGRRETQSDTRDNNLNGTIPFVDSVTGAISTSNVAAVSPTPSTRGSRFVFSAFAELGVPLVSPEMDIPLVRRLDLQLAGRFENYSDFGAVFKPKAAAAWDLADGLRLRGSYSQGFRAPNLEQTRTVQYSRLGSNTDFYRCEADLRAGRITNFAACNRGVSYAIFVSGNPDLQPEHSTNWSVGTVIQPKFIPSHLGRLTLTADFWSIQQTGIVGQFGPQNALVQDYLDRVSGRSNPNVIRAAVTSDDTPLFTGTGLPAAGIVTTIQDRFINLLPQKVQGIDLALVYNLRDTGIGDFDLDINVAKLTTFAREVPPEIQLLFDARAAGTINIGTPLNDTSNLIKTRSRPEWRATAALTWSLNQFQIGGFANLTSEVNDLNFLDANGNPFVVEGQTSFNIYAQYRIKGGRLDGTRFRIGMRNMFDQQPPLSSDGFLGALYNPYGRYIYATIGLRL